MRSWWVTWNALAEKHGITCAFHVFQTSNGMDVAVYGDPFHALGMVLRGQVDLMSHLGRGRVNE